MNKAMTLAQKYDTLLQRHLDLEDQYNALLQVVQSVHACAKPKEVKELDQIAADNPTCTESARAVMITPAVWTSINRHMARRK